MSGYSMKHKEFHRRNLPHWQPENAVFFVTTRLYGSLPLDIVKNLSKERKRETDKLKEMGLPEKELNERLKLCYNLYFGKFDELLDKGNTGPHWFKQDEIAQIWINALQHFDEERYKVICSTIMSNHVHFLFHKLDRSLSEIMKSLKGFSARQANSVLDRVGQRFWMEESFDRVVRDIGECTNRINYILNNPVKAGIVEHWKDWKYNYIHPDYLKYVR